LELYNSLTFLAGNILVGNILTGIILAGDILARFLSCGKKQNGGGSLKVIWAEFSTLSLAVLLRCTTRPQHLYNHA
jgi:hypothetical protein